MIIPDVIVATHVCTNTLTTNVIGAVARNDLLKLKIAFDQNRILRK